MGALSTPLSISYGNGLGVVLAPRQPLRLSNMAWDFPERPDLIALTTVHERLDFLREYLKSLCGIWDKLPRLFLDAYFRDIADCIVRDRLGIEALAAMHGGLFRAEDWSFAALCPLPRARLPMSPEIPVSLAFWTGDDLHAIEITGAGSPTRSQRECRARLRERDVRVIEIPAADLQRGQTGDLIASLPTLLRDFWKSVPLPASPFRIGELGETLPA
ncbi:MAG TPA: hypothetical protein VKB68_00160 [Stellaceae bacterium]|nr:hypothetical protein [Stellaceae bacterium]